MIDRIEVETQGQQLIEVSAVVQSLLTSSAIESGILTLFIQHTSASLVIQENADPSVQRDLLAWMNRLVPEHNPLYTHTTEGLNDGLVR